MLCECFVPRRFVETSAVCAQAINPVCTFLYVTQLCGNDFLQTAQEQQEEWNKSKTKSPIHSSKKMF